MNPKILAQKEQSVKEIADKVKSAQSVVVVEYRGLSVKKLQELRKTLRENQASMGVYKNSLVRRAMQTSGGADLVPELVGPNAIIFGDDSIKAQKVLFKFKREHDELNIKTGMVEGRIVDEKTLKELSRLPGKEGLISMLLSVLQAPIRNFAMIVDAVKTQKESAK